MKHYKLYTFVANMFSVIASFFLAYELRIGWMPNDTAFNNINDALVLSLLIFSYLAVFILYHPTKAKFGVFSRIKQAIINNLFMAGLFIMLAYMTKASSSVPRGFFVYYFGINALLSFAISSIFDLFVKLHLRNNKIQTVVYTDNKNLTAVVDRLIRLGEPNSRIRAVVLLGKGNKETLYRLTVTAKNKDKAPTYQLQKSGDKVLPEIVRINHVDLDYDFDEEKSTPVEFLTRNAIDRVIISTKSTNTERVREIADRIGEMGIHILITFDSFRIDGLNSRIDEMGNISVIRLAPRIFTDWEIAEKRILDIIGGLIGSLICIIVGIFVAPLIWLEDRGPIIFKQQRVGKGGHIFKIYKFRSMYVDAESQLKKLQDKNEMNGLMFKMKDDPRITKIGKFIRKTSIDELPQFFNVLKGDMSLVGYRPPVLTEYNQYKAGYKRRMLIKPGITGLWQVSGRSNITDFDEVLKLDNHYIDHWSILFDIKILFKTVAVVFKGEGAE